MTEQTTIVPSALRLAFEKAVKDSPKRSKTAATVRESLKHRKGITYRRRMWSVQRAKKNGIEG